MSNKDDPRFVKYVVRQTRAIFEGGIQRDTENPRWEREEELCSAKYPWLIETLLEAFLIGIRRAYKTEHAYNGFDYRHLPNLLAVEKKAACQLELLQLVNKEEDPDDSDMLFLSIKEIIQCMISWVKEDISIQEWGIKELLDIKCVVHNACDHLIDFLINLKLSIDGTFKALQEVEVCAAEEAAEELVPLPPPVKKKRERTASESGQLGAV